MHLPFSYYPDPPGGTEIYVRALALELRRVGVVNVICAPGLREAHYEHDGLPVWRFAVDGLHVDLRELYGEGNAPAANRVGQILDAEEPDIVHLHAFTSGVSLKVLRQAKLRGCRVVFTYHTPSVSCVRGTLLRDDGQSCDGLLKTMRCTRCLAAARGAGPVLAHLLGRVPPMAGSVLGRLGLGQRLGTALRCSELVALRHRSLRCLFHETDHIVAVCGWAARLLKQNGAPPEKITLCRPGIAASSHRPKPALKPQARSSGLRIAFLGRMHPSKGAHDLVAAFQGAPCLRATLDIYGVPQDFPGEGYVHELKAMAESDRRITFRGHIESNRVVEMLQNYDLLAVPSRTHETGPMVVLEAFAAGIPVIGWNVAGVNELVHHEVNGLLVERPSIQGWVSAFHRCANETSLLPTLRKGIGAPRAFKQVALEMLALYRNLE